MTDTRTTLKPSDLVVWADSRDGFTRRLNRLTGPNRFQERRVAGRDLGAWTTGDGTFHCSMVMDRSGDFLTDLANSMDPDARVWTLTTQGQHKGGRRHRQHLTFGEAQLVALTWLDRRFKVEEVGR